MFEKKDFKRCSEGECNGSDLYGFAALPSGYRYLYNGEYHYSDLGEAAIFHVAKGKYESFDDYKGWRYYIGYGGSFRSGFIGLDQGIPVRCVKNP